MNERPDIDIADFSILGWILKNNILNEKGEPIDFRDHLYLIDILTDWSKGIVIKKASQIGGSLIFNLKALFAIIKLKLNVLYTFPTDADTQEFVSSKTNKLLVQNPHVFKGMPTDNIERKEIDGRFLFFKGTVSKTAAIMTTADLLIHDEASRSDQQVLELMKSRTKASKYGGRWLFSNPTTEKDAVDENWQKSDQKEWHITCACGETQPLRWPESIDPARKCYQCVVCKKELTRDERRKGKWINRDGQVWKGILDPKYAFSGWHMSHLMILDISAAQIIQDSEGDQEYFYNFVLGEPYNPGDLKVSRATILDNWTPKNLDIGPYYLGVDVGNIKHYVLGTDLGVTKVGRFTRWSDLDDMMRMYKPHLVIDALPDNTMSRYFVENYENALMSFFQENTNNPQTLVWWGEGDRRGIVYSHRNRILDQLIDHILNAKMLFGVSSDKEFRDYVKHWETLRRVKEVDTKGIERYEWQSTTGEDHFVFATLYFYLAQLGRGEGTVFSPPSDEPPVFIGRDNIVGDLKEIMELMHHE
jgi:hypothetical protein